jgi:esterase/lipase
VLCITNSLLFAQSAPGAAAVQVAQNIAIKMKDSLGLSMQQKNQLNTVNLQLHTQKQNARTQYAGNVTQLTQALQAIEKTRDSVYQPILTPTQYDLYKIKKRYLISVL